MKIPITRVVFDEHERRLIQAPLETGWVVQGPYVKPFEEKFAWFTGAQCAVATTSCTTALHLALAALGVGPGDEVIVPAFTWVSTANVAVFQGATPVFCDIDLDTFNLDPQQLEAKITPRTKVIIPVHLFGLAAEMNPIMQMARGHGLYVVEDAACGFGAYYRGEHVGTFGEAGCFSFHPRKAITTGEAGITQDAERGVLCRTLRDHGASDLARHTGKALLAPSSIPLSRPSILESDIERVCEVLRSGQLVQGQYVRLLEEHVAQFVGVRETKAVASGTAALHLALLALGVGPGDEVIVPAFSFVATANVVELVGATPIFVDIDLKTFNIDPEQVEVAISPRTRAIMPVHEFGLACEIERIVALAERHGLPVVEDAACALGATSGGRQVGSFGMIGCFSLHPRKTITSGEGGLVVTHDEALAHRVDMLRNHGIGQVDGKKAFVCVGYNYRLTDFQGALVYAQALRLEENLAYRARLAATYEEVLLHPHVTLPSTPPGKVHSWQTYHVLLDDRIDRTDLMTYLQARGVQTGLGAQCIPEQPFYREKYALDVERKFPNALRAYRQGLALPLAETLTKEEITYVAAQLNAYIS